MASPQPDKYTKIANELLENVPKFRFNGTQLRIILAIWRYTYGFNRKDHEFAISFLAEAIKASRSQVDRELSALIDRKVLIVISGGNGKARVIRFNKNYDEWENSNRPRNGGQLQGVLQLEVGASSTLGTEPSSTLGTKKERKKTLKKGMLDLGIYKQIIDHLNKVANKRFSHKSEANKKLINGRVSEGRTLEDFFYVIDTKCSYWLDDPKMNEYLRPSTLFAQKNFENYLNQKPKQTNTQDKSISSRDKEVAFQQWLQDGNDPDAFDWS